MLWQPLSVPPPADPHASNVHNLRQLKYYVGYLEMNALKKRAELQWSDNFSLLRFHRFVLEAGPSDFENLTKRLKQTAAKTG